MKYVLGIGYNVKDYAAVQREWRTYNISLHFVNTIDEAVRRLERGNYVCVAICTDDPCFCQHLHKLHRIRALPIVVLSPNCDGLRRRNILQFGAAQYIKHNNIGANGFSCEEDAIWRYLDLEDKSGEPLTIIQRGNLLLYKEYRVAEMGSMEITLTGKEFDILYLLASHPKRVFTFEMLMDLVWGEEYIYTDKKTISNHMSNLRQKLKVCSDTKGYIKNVHGIGYKCDVI